MKTIISKMKKGFTLVEIMIVVAIIAILAAVAIPNFVRYRKASQQCACISNLKQIRAAVEQAKMSGLNGTSWDDIIGVDKFIKVTPTCPSGGTYSLPTDDTSDPTCSIRDGVFNHSITM